jgi:hypothetical protein
MPRPPTPTPHPPCRPGHTPPPLTPPPTQVGTNCPAPDAHTPPPAGPYCCVPDLSAVMPPPSPPPLPCHAGAPPPPPAGYGQYPPPYGDPAAAYAAQQQGYGYGAPPAPSGADGYGAPPAPPAPDDYGAPPAPPGPDGYGAPPAPPAPPGGEAPPLPPGERGECMAPARVSASPLLRLVWFWRRCCARCAYIHDPASALLPSTIPPTPPFAPLQATCRRRPQSHPWTPRPHPPPKRSSPSTKSSCSRWRRATWDTERRGVLWTWGLDLPGKPAWGQQGCRNSLIWLSISLPASASVHQPRMPYMPSCGCIVPARCRRLLHGHALLPP